MRISNWSSDVCSSDLIVEQAVEQLTVVQPKAMACLVDVDGLPRLRHQSPFVVSPGFSCRQPIEIRTLGPAGVSFIRLRGGNAGLLVSHVPSDKAQEDRKSTRLNSSH